MHDDPYLFVLHIKGQKQKFPRTIFNLFIEIDLILLKYLCMQKEANFGSV